METPMERARELVARYDHTDASELSGMKADARRIAAIAAAGLALRESISGPWLVAPQYRVGLRAVAAFDAAVAKAMAESEGE